MFTECGLSNSEWTLVGKEFHARDPATEKALSLRRRLVRGIQKSPQELERKRVSEQSSLR